MSLSSPAHSAPCAMTYDEALAFIHSVAWQGSRPGLERITELLRALGDPQKGLRFVHVAGTNGKGSVCSMTDSILREAGYHTGLFTSPYIWRFNERMAIDGEPIPDAELAEVTAAVRPFAEAMEDKPTEFELITAIGMAYFARNKCDVVVLEVGMGGRLDSTNIIEDPIACAITGIAFDHTAFLGNTLGAIAGEKAGIIKPGAPVVFGGQSEEAAKVIRDRAAALGSAYVQVDANALKVREASLAGCVFDYKDRRGVTISLTGLYQPGNAATVLELVDLLRARGMNIPESAVLSGLRKAAWRGRFEILHRDPLMISDGSHNPEGIAAAVASIRHYFPDQKILLLTGVMADKDYRAMAGDLAPLCAKVFTIKPDNPARALDAGSLAAVYRSLGVPAEGYDSADTALDAAAAEASLTGAPIFSLGSLYMYAQVREAKEKKWGVD